MVGFQALCLEDSMSRVSSVEVLLRFVAYYSCMDGVMGGMYILVDVFSRAELTRGRVKA